jgi:hypothetical protein
LYLFVFCGYFLPSVIAGARNHPNTGAIFLVNILVGWTIGGWAWALIWAITTKIDRPQEPAKTK